MTNVRRNTVKTGTNVIHYAKWLTSESENVIHYAKWLSY